jgi:serine/threonine protein kinase
VTSNLRYVLIKLTEVCLFLFNSWNTNSALFAKNIFVAQMPPQSKRWWVKIGDFGISKRVKNEDTAFRTQTGTQYFQAPEIQGFVDENSESSEYSNAVDVR